MGKDKFFAIGGALLGSLVEEGLEEVFPGIGELTYEGEIGGALLGLIASDFSKEETKHAIDSFVKYAYRKVNKETASENISEEDLKLFTNKFSMLPVSKKKEIINNFRNLDPYAYDFIIDFLKSLEKN